MPLPLGGMIRQIMVELDREALQAKVWAPVDVVNAQNLIPQGGTAKIGSREYNVGMKGSTDMVAKLNDLSIKTFGGGGVYVRDVAHVIDRYEPQTNVVRSDGKHAALLQVEKTGSASTLTISAGQGHAAERSRPVCRRALKITSMFNQSVCS